MHTEIKSSKKENKSASTKKFKVLVADDEKALANALSLKLKNEGFEVDTASNGQQVLDLLDNSKYDLLLLDLVMPLLDGFGVLEELNDKKISIPIIVTTNLSQKNDLEKVKALGAKEYFVKSNTSLSEIVNFVKEFLK